MSKEIRLNLRDLNQSTIRQYFCYQFDFIQFKYIFDRFELSKEFLRELVGKLNHCQLLELHSDILTSAKIIQVLSVAYLANAITFLKECRVDYWIEEFEYYNALDKFKYRLGWQKTDQYKKLHEVKNENRTI